MLQVRPLEATRNHLHPRSDLIAMQAIRKALGCLLHIDPPLHLRILLAHFHHPRLIGARDRLGNAGFEIFDGCCH